jgi:predicted TIM-barrel fold metal-dependent hydrolase
MLKPKMASDGGPEGQSVPAGLPPVIDAHVHVFPKRIFSAIWSWFDENAWRIRYRMSTREVFEFLLSRGVRHVIALQYAHKPGIAGELNRYLAERCREQKGRVTGMATVFPGEEGDAQILQEAFDAGLGGLKLHAHVQCFDMVSEAMYGLYACCRNNRKPVLMHVGREPKSPAYSCDPYELCDADRLERVVRDFPDLRICVPHLGLDELERYRRLIEAHDNLWLDTTMAIADYFPIQQTIDLSRYRPDRVMYGSDFPNIPYAWDTELAVLRAAGISRDGLARILSRNAVEFFGLDPLPAAC